MAFVSSAEHTKGHILIERHAQSANRFACLLGFGSGWQCASVTSFDSLESISGCFDTLAPLFQATVRFERWIQSSAQRTGHIMIQATGADNMLAVKIVALVFVALVCVIPLYLCFSRPRSRYHPSSRSRRRQRIASISAFAAIVLVMAIIAVLAVSGNFFTDMFGE